MSKEAIYMALDEMDADNLKHFDIRCPQCRKTNRIPLKRLQRAAPEWIKKADAAKNN
jgi:hypothetical protein